MHAMCIDPDLFYDIKSILEVCKEHFRGLHVGSN